MALVYDLCLCISFLTNLQSIFSCGSYIQYSYSVNVFDSALLKGCYYNKSYIVNSWKFNDLLLFLNEVPQDKEYSQEIKLLIGGSLSIPSVSFYNEGTYLCIRGSRIYSSHHLRIKAWHPYKAGARCRLLPSALSMPLREPPYVGK